MKWLHNFHHFLFPLQEKLFHFWFNTFFVREEVQVPEAPVNGNEDMDAIPPPERSSRAMSCDEQSRVPPVTIQKPRYMAWCIVVYVLGDSVQSVATCEQTKTFSVYITKMFLFKA